MLAPNFFLLTMTVNSLNKSIQWCFCETNGTFGVRSGIGDPERQRVLRGQNKSTDTVIERTKMENTVKQLMDMMKKMKAEMKTNQENQNREFE